MTHAFPSGVKDVYELVLASGRRIRATANHPFLTYDGWMPLAELAPGARIGAIRHVPPPLQITPRDPDEIVLLAHLIGDDSRSYEKFVPDWVFGLPKEQVGLFLRHLWATDGCVHVDQKNHLGRIYYASTSRRLVDDVARLLLRFNVFTRLKRTSKAGYRPCWQLHVYGSENQLRFCQDIGVHGARGERVAELASMLVDVRPNTNLDTVPREVWGRVREVLAEKHVTHREFAAAMGTRFSGSGMWKRAPSRERLARVAGILDDADLEVMATNDVFWDRIRSITPVGSQPVYDATVLGVHNFVAESLPIHNSIEQDADMVILLHRDDVYEKESTRPGEADLIVAKHRNGATRDITVAFQGHYSRFVDMAH